MTTVVCKDADRLAEEAAERFVRAAAGAVAARGRFLVALAGGSTPEKLYNLLARPDRQGRVDWGKTFVLFGDERFVPADDPRSNFGLAKRTLLDNAPVPAGQVFPMPTAAADPAAGAAEYERTLARVFGLATALADKPPVAPMPRFDLILLGLGDDGHTASLFPGKPALQEQRAWVTASPPGVLPPPVDRITLTFPVLNAAREVMFLVAGANKAGPLRDVLEGGASPDRAPAAGVRPTDGTLTWLVDEPAAASLASRR